MSNFSKPVAAENEILKAADVSFGYDAAVDNIMVAMRAALSGGKHSFVIGGKVKPYASLGMNAAIEPIFVYESNGEKCAAETEETAPVSFEEADSALDRLDIVEVGVKEEEYDFQSRAMNDPTTGTKSFVEMATKKRVALDVKVKKGEAGSPNAPQSDDGYVKIAEVLVAAGIHNIEDGAIRNITARKGGAENSEWTVEKDAAFNPGYLTEIRHNFLAAHTEDGRHKPRTIGADALDFGTENGKVKGTLIPSGRSMTIHNEDFVSQSSITDLVKALAENMNEIYPLANSVLGRFSVLAEIPAACSTGNVDIKTGGIMSVDGVACNVGDTVFLKDQADPKENGFWEVQTGAWNRKEGYKAINESVFADKLVMVESGNENKGRIFYLEDNAAKIGKDALNFRETLLSAAARNSTVAMRDRGGRLKAAAPKSGEDAANKEYVDSAVLRNSASSVGFPYGGERFLVFDFSDQNHRSLKIKAGTHIRLDIEGGASRWLDAESDASFHFSNVTKAGKNYYVYLVPSGESGATLVASENATYPNDVSASYNAGNTRKIGQFHTLCADAGDSLQAIVAEAPSCGLVAGNRILTKKYSDTDGFREFYECELLETPTAKTYYDVLKVRHPLAGFRAGDILPESVWCLTFRPLCSPEGMVYDADTDMAVDIYLQSGKGSGTRSEFGGTVTHSRQHPNHQDDMRKVGKRLLHDHEFSSAASGSNECTNIQGSSQPNTAGGHVDTAGRRMVSFIGAEDCCGAYWQWLEGVSALGYGAAHGNTKPLSAVREAPGFVRGYVGGAFNASTGQLSGSGWVDLDGQDSLGAMYCVSAALLAGGRWNDGASCGSRSRSANAARSDVAAVNGGRGASRVSRKA